jgi:hypothetical protein
VPQGVDAHPPGRPGELAVKPQVVGPYSTLTDAAQRGSPPSIWPQSYALETKPIEYATSDTPGVLVNQHDGQKFIFHDGEAYAVKYDSGNATYQVVSPNDRARPAYPVRLDKDTGQWIFNGDTGLKGGGDTPPDRQRLLQRQADIHREIMHLSLRERALQQQHEDIARRLDDARHSVHVRTSMAQQAQQMMDDLNARQQHGERRLQDRVQTWTNELQGWQQEVQRAQQEVQGLQQSLARVEEAQGQLPALVQQLVQQGDDVELQLKVMGQRQQPS